MIWPARLPAFAPLCIAVAVGAGWAAAAMAETPVPRAATVREKARAVNTGGTMGCLEEIGTLPRTAAELYEAGGVSGSILAARATYGKGASRAVYGDARRFVSHERLGQILARLFQDARRFARHPGDEVPRGTRLFAFANTVSTSPYNGGGWAGIRFAPEGRPTAQVEVSFRVVGPGPGEQPALIGKLGVNLIHAAFHEAATPTRLLAALTTELGAGPDRRGSIRALRTSGPGFEAFDAAQHGLDILESGAGDHVMMARDAGGLATAEPGDVLHGRAALLFPAAPGPWSDAPRIRHALAPLLASPEAVPAVMPLPVLSVPARDPDRSKLLAAQAAALEVGGICLLSRAPDAGELGRFLAGATRAPVLLASELPDVKARFGEAKRAAGAPSADLRFLIRVTATELSELSHTPALAAALDEGAVIALDAASGAALVPLRRLGPLLAALERATLAKTPGAPLYRVLAPEAQAKSGLPPGQVAALAAHLRAGRIICAER